MTPTPRHRREMDGWINTPCAFGLEGCDDLACVCECHSDSEKEDQE